MNKYTIAEAGFCLKTFAWLICILGPLSFSGSQGGRFLQRLGEGNDSIILMGIGCCIIFSNPIIGMFVGIAKRNSDYASVFFGCLCWLGVVSFSMTSSSLAITNNAGETIQNQIHSSQQVKTMKSMIDSNLAAIQEKQSQIAGRDPVRWASKRDGWARDIEKLNADNNSLISKLSAAEADGTGSSVAKSFKSLEQFGITVTKIAMLAAFLLDLIPFFASTQIGTSTRMKHVYTADDSIAPKEPTPKKSQRPNLTSVA